MIKRDINLIPKKKKIKLSLKLGLFFGIVCIICLVFAGIYFPSYIINEKEDRIANLEKELEGYADSVAAFDDVSGEIRQLRAVKNIFENFFSTGKEVVEIAGVFEDITPAGVVVLNYDFTKDEIIISGQADSDLRIATFENLLWGTGMFSGIDLGTLSTSGDKRLFSFTLVYNDNFPEGGENR